MRSIVQALLVAVAVGGCPSGTDRDRRAADASSGGGTGGFILPAGTGGVPTGGTGGVVTAPPGTGGSPARDGGPDTSDDPCGLALGFPSAPPLDGSAPECPRCGPYAEKWNPSCSKAGITCDYLQPGGFGAFCRCGGLEADAGTPAPDGGLKFGCGL